VWARRQAESLASERYEALGFVTTPALENTVLNKAANGGVVRAQRAVRQTTYEGGTAEEERGEKVTQRAIVGHDQSFRLSQRQGQEIELKGTLVLERPLRQSPRERTQLQKHRSRDV